MTRYCDAVIGFWMTINVVSTILPSKRPTIRHKMSSEVAVIHIDVYASFENELYEAEHEISSVLTIYRVDKLRPMW